MDLAQGSGLLWAPHSPLVSRCLAWCQRDVWGHEAPTVVQGPRTGTFCLSAESLLDCEPLEISSCFAHPWIPRAWHSARRSELMCMLGAV